MKNKKAIVNFDDYADTYENLLEKQLAFFSKDRGYFSSYKVELAKRFCYYSPSRILDFGCGIGLSLPYLAKHFPSSKIFATDISNKSLEDAQRQNPNVVTISDSQLEGAPFDLIFVTGVFHHVPRAKREDVMQRLAQLLTPKGTLCLFEHNPYNPVTRYLVATCPFDEDAELIALRKMKHLVKSIGGLEIQNAGYCLFLPSALARFRLLENRLRWLPLGGQYYIVASPKSL